MVNSFSFQKSPTQKILELGGGDNPHELADVNVDIRPGPRVDFTVDFNSDDWPISSGEFDAVIARFVLEHVSYLRVPNFLRECYRILKPGGKAVIIVPNTQAQLQWIQEHLSGWDGKDIFTSASEILFGSQDYEANAHKSFFSPTIISDLLTMTGYVNLTTQPYGERSTDLIAIAEKPMQAPKTAQEPLLAPGGPPTNPEPLEPVLDDPGGSTGHLTQPDIRSIPREEIFSKDYFNGGHRFGGYANLGYQDFPCHVVTANQILARRPNSVIEIGTGRGYVLKRIADTGIPAVGLEISKHCYMTRVYDWIRQVDICTPWPINTKVENIPEPDMRRTYDYLYSQGYRIGKYDLLYSVAVMEHIPEESLPEVIQEMVRVSERGLHYVDFGKGDDGFDKSHVTLHDKAWWEAKFKQYAPDYPVEICDKEDGERMDQFPKEIIEGDGKVKLNLGSFTTMFHGWVNIDQHNLGNYAQAYGYKFQQHDLKQGLPYPTGGVDLIFSSHCLEHLSFDDGLKLLKECRRVLKPAGAMRILVPDAELLMCSYTGEEYYYPMPNHRENVPQLYEFHEINDNCEKAPTMAMKLWALLHEGHQAIYDYETLAHQLTQAGLVPSRAPGIGKTQLTDNKAMQQLLKETFEMHFGLSLVTDAIPKIG